MSHTVTVTRTTTMTSTSVIVFNTGYLKTFPGLLKLFEVILSGVALGLVAYYSSPYIRQTPKEFFLVIITTLFIASFCLLFSCLISLSTASIISKTVYELVYHFIAFMLILASSVTLLVEINDRHKHAYYYNSYLTATVIGLVLAVLYLFSSVLAYRSYKGF